MLALLVAGGLLAVTTHAHAGSPAPQSPTTKDTNGSDSDASNGQRVDPNNPQPPKVGDTCEYLKTETCWRLPNDYPAGSIGFSVEAGALVPSQRVRYQIVNAIDGLAAGGEIGATTHQALTLRPGDTLSLPDQQDTMYAKLTVAAVAPLPPAYRFVPRGNSKPPAQNEACKRDDVEPIQAKSCWKVEATGTAVAFSVFAAGGRPGHVMDVDIYNDIDHLSQVHHIEYGGPHQALVMRPGDRLIIRGNNDRNGGLYIAAVAP